VTLAQRADRHAPVLLGLLYLLAVLTYVLLGRGQPVPQVTPDEFTYGTLARSLADGDGLAIRGEPFELRAALYIYAIAPAWLAFDSLVDAYAAAKAIGAVLCCLVVLPTWLLARRFMSPGLALIPAALVVAGSWMTQAGQLITENLAFPLATGSLAALTAALLRPGSRAGWVALILAAAATGARAQLGVVFAIVVLALVLDVLLASPERAVRLRAHAPVLGVATLISLLGAFALLADPSLLGSYAGLRDQTDLDRSLSQTGEQALAFVVMTGILPFLLALAASLRRSAWGADDLRPLLVVCWVTVVAFVVQSGILTTAFDGAVWSIQRYVEYGVPVLLVVAVAGVLRGLVSARDLALVTAATAAALLLTPAVQSPQEQRALLALATAGDAFGLSLSATLAVLAVLLGGGTSALLLARERGGVTLPAVAAVALLAAVVLGFQSQQGWDWQRDQARTWRAGFPADLEWVDAAAGDRPATRLIAASNPFRAETTAFFNRSIATIAAPEEGFAGRGLLGPTCPWGIDEAGVVVLSDECGAAPSTVLLDDDLAKLTFTGQRVLDEHPGVGRVVALAGGSPGRPRLEALVSPACSAVIPTQNLRTGRSRRPETGCLPQSTGQLWLDEPGRLRMRFRGGTDPLTVQVLTSTAGAPRTVDLPAGGTAEVTVPVPAGPSQFQVDLGLGEAGTQPAQLQESIELVQGERRRELLY
jgi:hypothetical protein